MKAKKWLTIITLFVATISLVLAYVIGKDNNSISYDITMALLGSAILGFIMSITEYYAERRKAMEEFYIQAIKVLQKLRKIKYLEVDAPLDLVIDAFYEEQNQVALLIWKGGSHSTGLAAPHIGITLFIINFKFDI
jgi:hypothetical protein